MKKYTNKVIFGIAGLVILVLLILVSNNQQSTQIKNQVSDTNFIDYPIKDFNAIYLNGRIDATIKSGNYSVQFNGNNNDIFVKDNVLHVGSRINHNKVIITLPKLDNILVSGSGDVNINGKNLQLSNNEFSVNISGKSEFKLSNAEFKKINIVASGMSEISLDNSQLKNVDLQVSGTSDIILNKFESGILYGVISGMADVQYSGTLQKNNLQHIGATSIRHCDNKCSPD